MRKRRQPETVPGGRTLTTAHNIVCKYKNDKLLTALSGKNVPPGHKNLHAVPSGSSAMYPSCCNAHVSVRH